MPTLVLSNFNIVCATLGGFITLFGLVSYLFKERFYLSEALISLVAGVIFSPHATNFVKPLEYAEGLATNVDVITFYFSRLVLGVQLVIAGVQLPSRYVSMRWRSLALLLGPGMTIMWLSASLIIWGMVPNLPFLHSLALAACVTPTDPVLSNSIVKGKFADKNIPKDLQKIIIAESGANDGLGYPFLFLALYLIKYVGHGGLGQTGGASKAMGLWFGEIWGYTIALSIVYGITVGWIAKELLQFAERRKFVDRESFLVFAITLALFIVGTCGMIGSDDVLACFVAGNVFTWDDWFRLETLDDSLQPTIDMLLNLSIFIWYGAVCPWALFRTNDVIPLFRLIFLGALILLFRRIPIVLAMHTKIPEIEHFQQAAFVGFFGPIGVSAIFYLYVSLDFLDGITVDGTPDGTIREDAARLKEVMRVVIWFLAICSIVVHGLSVPIGKLGYRLPRTMTSAFSTSAELEDPNIQILARVRHWRNSDNGQIRQRRNPNERPHNDVFRVGGSVIRPNSGNGANSPNDEPSRPINFQSGNNSMAPSTVDTSSNFRSRSPQRTVPEQTGVTLARRRSGVAGSNNEETGLEYNGEASRDVSELEGDGQEPNGTTT